MIFLTATESVLSIVLLIALGYILQQKNWFADTFAANLSRLIMNIALPASIFVSVLEYLNRDKLMALTDGLIYGALSVILGYLAAILLVKLCHIRAGRRGTFINAIVNANTIFIGLPLNTALFGETAMPYFLVYYVLNTVSTWASVYFIAGDASQTDNHAAKPPFNWKKLLPAPLLGFLVALIFLLAELSVPTFIHAPLQYLVALLGKFVLAPLIMVILIYAGKGVLPLPLLESKTLIVQSAVPALAVLPILAHEAKGDVSFATNIVTTSTLLFIVVMPVVDALLQFLH